MKINKNDENDLDYIVVCLCRGLAEWDANEVLPEAESGNNL